MNNQANIFVYGTLTETSILRALGLKLVYAKPKRVHGYKLMTFPHLPYPFMVESKLDDEVNYVDGFEVCVESCRKKYHPLEIMDAYEGCDPRTHSGLMYSRVILEDGVYAYKANDSFVQRYTPDRVFSKWSKTDL